MPSKFPRSFLLHKHTQYVTIEQPRREEGYMATMTASGLLRQFHEPHEWWDQYEAERDEAYKSLIKGKTCLDCAKCRVCERDASIGYCTEDGEFRYADDVPEKEGMECFRAA